jgi:hypothetical protein
MRVAVATQASRGRARTPANPHCGWPTPPFGSANNFFGGDSAVLWRAGPPTPKRARPRVSTAIRQAAIGSAPPPAEVGVELVHPLPQTLGPLYLNHTYPDPGPTRGNPSPSGPRLSGSAGSEVDPRGDDARPGAVLSAGSETSTLLTNSHADRWTELGALAPSGGPGP